MRYYAAPDERHLESWRVQDGPWLIALWNEQGDVIATVNRPDGTQGHAFGGAVYPWPGFANTYDHDDRLPPAGRNPATDLTARELAVVTAMGRKVGWAR